MPCTDYGRTVTKEEKRSAKKAKRRRRIRREAEATIYLCRLLRAITKKTRRAIFKMPEQRGLKKWWKEHQLEEL